MDKLLLIDAYAMIYRAYYAFIKNPRINSKGLNTSAIFGFINSMDDVIRRVQPTHVGVAFDPKGKTFRHEAYEAYKAQREATPEDIRTAVPIIKQVVEAYRIPLLEVPGFEADDVIGTMANKASQAGFEVYMVTPDKDYGQLVDEHVFMYRPRHTGGFEQMGTAEVCAKYGIANKTQVIDLLALMGDKADNIPGCPGVGEKTAVKLIADFGNVENLLENTAQIKGALQNKVVENAENIRFSKFLATIRTDVPIQFKPTELQLEEPDKDALAKLYAELEFRHMAAKLQGDNAPAPAKSKAEHPAQMSLFDAPADATPATPAATFVPTDADYRLADTPEAQDTLLAQLMQQKQVCFDTETTSTDPTVCELVGFSFSWAEKQAYFVPCPANQAQCQAVVERFRPFFESEDITKIGQNLKYDLLVLRQYKVEARGQIFDTMVAHYLLQPELRHGMDYLAEIYLNYHTISYEDITGPKGKSQLPLRQVPLEQLRDYACEDADITLRLHSIFAEELRKNDLNQLFYDIEMPLVRVLVDMESAGVRIDTQALAASSKTLTAQMQDIEREIQQQAGQAFNISSPKQVGEILFDVLKIDSKAKKTKTGQYITSEDVLENLRGKHPVVDLILEHRAIKKLLSTYIDALPQLINPRTGKVHTSYNQTVTATGRLSSSNPNLQNIPVRTERGKEIRKAFIPDENCVFISADYSQIELRIMAHLSGDQHMCEAFLQGDDIHAATAAKVFRIPLAEVTADMRRKAKTANFGIIYGISAFGLAERLGVARSEAKELIDSYFATYPQISEYIENCKENARQRGYVETLLHRKRYLPDINSKNSIVRGFAERNAVNAPIQGTAADIIKIAMVRIHQRLQQAGLHAQMTMQVHDELNFSVPENEAEQVRAIVVEEMQGAMALSVPLLVDCGVGKNWLEAH